MLLKSSQQNASIHLLLNTVVSVLPPVVPEYTLTPPFKLIINLGTIKRSEHADQNEAIGTSSGIGSCKLQRPRIQLSFSVCVGVWEPYPFVLFSWTRKLSTNEA